MVVLTDKQTQEFEAFINELPTKYGVLILRLFTKFAQENAEATKKPVEPAPQEQEAATSDTE
jgi:hypothetical protein